MRDRLQLALGLEIKDIALLCGGLGLIIGVLLLGFSSGRGKRRWLFWLGWLALLIAGVMLAYGGYRSSGNIPTG